MFVPMKWRSYVESWPCQPIDMSREHGKVKVIPGTLPKYQENCFEKKRIFIRDQIMSQILTKDCMLIWLVSYVIEYRHCCITRFLKMGPTSCINASRYSFSESSRPMSQNFFAKDSNWNSIVHHARYRVRSRWTHYCCTWRACLCCCSRSEKAVNFF